MILFDIKIEKKPMGVNFFCCSHPFFLLCTLFMFLDVLSENIPSAFATWPVERTNKVSKAIKNMKLTFF